jgi:benzylsuccinate CoA-transferase BbsF subunit
LNLKKARGRELALKLIQWADVVCENFSPGAMAKLGLDYESARKVKPDIIYWSNSQLGQSGPYASYRGFGHQAVALSGVYHLSGWSDRDPSPPWSAYTDFIVPRFAVAAILAALDHRRRTGSGAYLDQSQLECALQFIAPVVMGYWVNKSVMKRCGNRLPYAAPHGVYRCKGDDRWVAIAVFDDPGWEAFCQTVEKPGWVRDSRFSTLGQRKKNEDELDRLVEDWTTKHDAEKIERLMQAAGVSANVVEDAEDLFEDPQLKHREHLQYLIHPVIGLHGYEAPAFRLSKTPFQLRPGPCLGQHNRYVYEEILRLSEDEITDLLREKVITTDADLPLFTVQV